MNKIVSMSRLSEANPEGCFWPVIFTEGCNLRCPYCINSTSIVEPVGEKQFLSVEQVIEQLEEWGEDGVMISGGEPLIPTGESSIFEIIELLRSYNINIGISTNGTWPNELQKLIKSDLVNFVALDCKFNPALPTEDIIKYSHLLGGYPEMSDDMLLSLSALYDWHELNPDTACSEVRTTLYPELIGELDIIAIAANVHQKSRFVLQQYRKNVCFDGQRNTVEPYYVDEVNHLLSIAQRNCEAKVSIRWP